jgi:hypothetical protein
MRDEDMEAVQRAFMLHTVLLQVQCTPETVKQGILKLEQTELTAYQPGSAAGIAQGIDALFS